jgi:hypothetical protein
MLVLLKIYAALATRVSTAQLLVLAACAAGAQAER